jgi:hypothetical protein
MGRRAIGTGPRRSGEGLGPPTPSPLSPPRRRVPNPGIAPSGGSILLLEDERHHWSAGVAGSRMRDSDARDLLPV